MIDWHSFPPVAPRADDGQTPQETYRTEDIHRQLERICASRAFRGSLRLTRFLSFIVETALAGKSDTIKAYTIAVEALGRGSEFDPQSDPIVRVEAGRLRQALARYYAGPGRDDPVAIDLPRGAYVPVFHLASDQKDNLLVPSQEPETARPDSNDAQLPDTNSIGKRANFFWLPRLPRHSPRRLRPTAKTSKSGTGIVSAVERMLTTRIFRIAFCVVAILAMLQVLFDIGRPFMSGDDDALFFKLWPARNAAAAQPPTATDEPLIYVEPVAITGAPPPDSQSARMLRERLFDALARFDDIAVVADLPPSRSIASFASKFNNRLSSQYSLSTMVYYYPNGALAAGVRLIDMADGTIAWSKTYEHEYEPNERKGRISRDVAQMLLQQFGVIQAREAGKRADADPMQDPYRCMLDANAYLRSFNPSRYGPARDCLEHATAEGRPLVGAFVKLARLYMFDYEFGRIGRPAGDLAVLDRAYQMVVRAVDIKPTSAAAQFAMEQVLLARRDFEEAKIAGDNALSLNPYDNAVIFGHATRLILTGQIDEGLAALRQNTNKKTAVWTGHHFVLALGSYLKSDLTTADVETSQIANENFAPGLMLDALVAANNKNRLRARHDVALLYAKYPSWRDDPHANIGYFLPDHDMADRISTEFTAVTIDLKNHADMVGSVQPAEHP